jgi:fatty-acyl-CoA synthase
MGATSSRPDHVAPTLVEAVRRLAGDTERGFVFVQPDGQEKLHSFRDLCVEAERRGAGLRALGLAKGDRIAMVVPSGDEFVLSFLGALFAGVVPVPVYPQLTLKNVEIYHETVAHIARASGAAMLLTTDAAKPFVEPVRSRVPELRAVVTVHDVAAAGAAGDGRCDVAVDPGDLAFLQFTSGSTSRPKGVMVTHANLAANAEAFMIHGLDRDPAVDKGVSWLPLFHDMGLIGFVVGPLFTNIPCVFLPTASFVRAPRLWLDKIHQHRGTITYAPNFAYALVAKRLKDREVEGLDLSSLRIAGCGAEPIQAKALRDFAARLAPARFDARAFVPSYGMAEATLAVTFVPRGEGLRTDEVDARSLASGTATPSGDAAQSRSIVDCGEAFPGHDVAIIDDAGRVLGERQVGQIVVAGPSVAAGYFDQPELTAATFKPLDGRGQTPWLHTGDLGYLAGGRLFVCGRVKDVIIVRGRNYYPSDIEWAVGEVSHVRRGNVVAFGVQASASGQLVNDGSGEEQLVVCCEGASSDADAIRDAAAARIAEQFGLAVREVVVVALASLPRTSSGKPQRRATRAMYLDGQLLRARPASPRDALAASASESDA